MFKRSPAESPYVKGIQLYIDAVQNESSVFQNWKVLLYTDTATLSVLESNKIFVNKPNVDICLVKWPYYTPDKDIHSINGDILRCMRFRAFFDFPTIPVFVRDADTIFITDLPTNLCSTKLLKNECVNILYEWEKNFYLGAQNHPNTWIFGTSLGYKKDWHTNSKQGYIAPLGAFAGFQSIIPTVPCFQSEDLWKKAVDYIQDQSKRIEGKPELENGIENLGIQYVSNDEVSFSNDDTIEKIGKDERILLFIFFLNCDIKNIFFFELDYFHTRTIVLKGKFMNQSNYPTTVFARGSNQNIKNLFNQAKHAKKKLTNTTFVNAPFSINFKEKLQSIFKRNREAYKLKYNALKKNLKTIKNKKNEFDKLLDISTIITDIYNVLEQFDKDEQLKYYHTQYQTTENVADKLKKNYLSRMVYSNSEDERKSEKSKLENSIYAKNKAMNEFLTKSLSLKSKEEIVNAVSNWKKPKIKSFLEYYTSSQKGGKKYRTRKLQKRYERLISK